VCISVFGSNSVLRVDIEVVGGSNHLRILLDYLCRSAILNVETILLLGGYSIETILCDNSAFSRL
jgi:hypothetical protein